jgi:hypothetical protein
MHSSSLPPALGKVSALCPSATTYFAEWNRAELMCTVHVSIASVFNGPDRKGHLSLVPHRRTGVKRVVLAAETSRRSTRSCSGACKFRQDAFQGPLESDPRQATNQRVIAQDPRFRARAPGQSMAISSTSRRLFHTRFAPKPSTSEQVAQLCQQEARQTRSCSLRPTLGAPSETNPFGANLNRVIDASGNGPLSSRSD